MSRFLLAITILLALSLTVTAGPIDFLRRVGHSIAHPHHAQKSRHTAPRHATSRTAAQDQTSETGQQTADEEIPVTRGEQPGAQRPTDSAPETIAPPSPHATSATPVTLDDLPFGMSVPNRPGTVVSPYSPDGGYVDVTGYQSGAPVKDPYTGKIFRVP